MGVGHFEAEHGHAHLAAGEGGLDGLCHALGEDRHAGYFGVVKVEVVVYLAARYYECVALCQRIDVEEGVELVILGALVARYFAGCYFREYVHCYGVLRLYGCWVMGFYGYAAVGLCCFTVVK